MEKRSIVPFKYEGTINDVKSVGFVDPEIIEGEKRRERFEEWVKAMSEPETEETLEQEIHYWHEHLPKLRPNLTEEMPTADVTGLERIAKAHWGHELMAFSLVFVAGKERFIGGIPPALTRDFIQKCSLATTEGLYTMSVSSLYWAERENEIDPAEAQIQARNVAWAFGISQERYSEPVKDLFGPALNEYHGKYPFYEPKGFDGSDAIKVVRERLGNKPITVPWQLRDWIYQPPHFTRDHNIISTIPYMVDYSEEPMEKYLQFV